MDIVDVDKHAYAGTYPCRVPVWWGRFGTVGAHPDVPGVTGKRVILRIEKRFNRFERVLARLFRAPREVRRPLDVMNSMLWELSNGTRTFEEICRHMNDVFQEDIAPVVDRTAAGIDALKRRNMMTVLSEEFTNKWPIQPGVVPEHQSLGPLGESLNIDSSSIEGDGSITEEE
jgi:hypothetical protein